MLTDSLTVATLILSSGTGERCRDCSLACASGWHGRPARGSDAAVLSKTPPASIVNPQSPISNRQYRVPRHAIASFRWRWRIARKHV